MQLKTKTFKNYYCDALSCALGQFFDVNKDFEEEKILEKLTIEDLNVICDYVVLKNINAGVGELFLKVPYKGLAKNSLEKFGLKGREVLSAKLLNELSTKDFLGGKVMLFIEDLLDYNEGFLTEISDFTGKVDLPVMISLGQDLEETGKLVNQFKLSPASVLEDFGFLDRECFLYGLNFIDKEDQKLLKNYSPTLIFSPRSDAESGKGAINLYNFIYNRLKFCFSSGKCYNVNMLSEAKLAKLNTNNLMFQNDLISNKDLLDALYANEGEIVFQIDEESLPDVIFDEELNCLDNQSSEKFALLKTELLKIVKRIKG